MKAFERGVLIRTTGDIIALSPPLIITKGQINELIDHVREVLQDDRLETARRLRSYLRSMAAPGENLRINPDRLWDSLMEMAKIGPGIAGGNNRQTLTDEDGEGRHLFKRWCEAAGLDMGVDQMGTMFARREGTDPDALPVYVGSHLDTQPTGGKYDGVLGVLGGLEVVRTLNDLGIKTKHPIVVTNWTNEEGTRFAPAMLASGVFAGVHEQDWAYDRKDARGQDASATSWSASAGRATSRSARARCTPSSSCISSRARSSRTRASTSASSPTARACSGCR